MEVPHEITILTYDWVPLAHLTQATKIAIIEFAKPIIRSVVFDWTLTPSVFKDPNLEPRWQQQELPQTQMVRKSYDITIWARGGIKYAISQPKIAFKILLLKIAKNLVKIMKYSKATSSFTNRYLDNSQCGNYVTLL